MSTTIWTREALLASAGIKPVEWPEGWYLWGPPDYKVSPERPPAPKGKGRGSWNHGSKQ